MTQKILIAADHGGFILKQHLLGFLQKTDAKIIDLGTDSLDAVDYPDFGQKAAKAILDGTAETGIVICGTGIGISITANRFKGIRCALCSDIETAKLSRQHNNANLLALGGRVLDPELAVKIVEAFLTTEFEGGRHENRIVKIDNPV
jgi:ribose 5-phosphate isomerase B